MHEKEEYVLRGGKAGYDRLKVLARERWPDTAALLRRAGIAPGMKCLDLGCDGGTVTLELAKHVAPGGSVVGIDMDQTSLDLARRAAAERGLSNVVFREANANNWEEPGTYDLVYARFLLHHLKQPLGTLRRMWAGVREGGVLVVEDADFGGWCSDPPNEGFDFFVRTYEEVVRKSGGDPHTGRKLRRFFVEAGIPGPELTLVQPVRTEGEAKMLAWSTLEGSSDAILSNGVATREELDTALARLREFCEDPHTLIAGPRIFQLWAKRNP
ncbi:MAG: class I SAM-dependent methyltransferase [Thermoplasmata archaeon]|nr:class I SAM-dependent methyltransferase [Thermoplasmata archaeon]